MNIATVSRGYKVYNFVYDILKKAKLLGQRTRQRLPGGRVGTTVDRKGTGGLLGVMEMFCILICAGGGYMILCICHLPKPIELYVKKINFTLRNFIPQYFSIKKKIDHISCSFSSIYV